MDLVLGRRYAVTTMTGQGRPHRTVRVGTFTGMKRAGSGEIATFQFESTGHRQHRSARKSGVWLSQTVSIVEIRTDGPQA